MPENAGKPEMQKNEALSACLKIYLFFVDLI
jgi:hypothetical protein